jgi:hypothetical protein
MKVDDTMENGSRCLCGSCPTYPDQDEPWLYCARGRSKLPIERKDCLCPGCPVYADYDLDRTFYCDSGAAE